VRGVARYSLLTVKCSVSFRNGISSSGLGWAISASNAMARPSTP
jgi:hypothetical protein